MSQLPEPYLPLSLPRWTQNIGHQHTLQAIGERVGEHEPSPLFRLQSSVSLVQYAGGDEGEWCLAWFLP